MSIEQRDPGQGEEAGEVPAEFAGVVKAIGPPIVPGDLDALGKLREIEDKSLKLRTVLQAWERQHREERDLRGAYAKWLLVGLGVQVLVVNLAFFTLGLRWIQVQEWMATTFIMAVFAQISTMTFFIIKYLFPKVGSEVLSLLEKL